MLQIIYYRKRDVKNLFNDVMASIVGNLLKTINKDLNDNELSKLYKYGKENENQHDT